MTFDRVRMLMAAALFLGTAAGEVCYAEEGSVDGYPVSLTVPDGWDLRGGMQAPILMAAIEKSTGDNISVIAFKQPDASYVLDRKAADDGLLKEMGPSGTIVRSTGTKVAGLPAYCVIASCEFQQKKLTVARLIPEKPVDGFMYCLQYTKMGGGDVADALIQEIGDRLHLKAK